MQYALYVPCNATEAMMKLHKKKLYASQCSVHSLLNVIVIEIVWTYNEHVF